MANNNRIMNEHFVHEKLVTYKSAFKDENSPCLLEQSFLLDKVMHILQQCFGKDLETLCVRSVDMERIYEYTTAFANVHQERMNLTMRSYCWLRDLLLGKVTLSLYELPNFFLTVMLETLKVCPRVYRFIM